jgi:Helix-hairpin-helix motif
MDLPVHDAQNVDLNSASEEQLANDVGLGVERASRIRASRPFRSWDDVKRIEGLTDAVVEQLQRAGAVLGDPDRAEVVPRPQDQHLKPEERDVTIRGRRL